MAVRHSVRLPPDLRPRFRLRPHLGENLIKNLIMNLIKNLIKNFDEVLGQDYQSNLIEISLRFLDLEQPQ